MHFTPNPCKVRSMANSEKIADLEKSIADWKTKNTDGAPAFVAEIIEKLEAELAAEKNS